jgi:hypothetical protein
MSAPTAGAARTLFDAAERRHWDEHGFVLVRGALSEAEVSRVRMCALDLVDGRAAMNLGQAGNASDTCVLNAASALPELAELVDHPSVFARVLGLMGP